MSDYEFTETEQAAIEKAAERLEHVLVNLDAIDAAYDIAQEIREALAAAALSATKDELAKVHDFIHARHEFVGVLRQYSTEDMTDYHRWTGHAEARRELAETLGIELDSKSGGLRSRSEVSR